MNTWMTCANPEDERDAWARQTHTEILETLNDWHEDHPEWNPESTPSSRKSDAYELWQWSRDETSPDTYPHTKGAVCVPRPFNSSSTLEKGHTSMSSHSDSAPADRHVVEGFLFAVHGTDSAHRSVILTVIDEGDSITATMQPRDERPAETVTADPEHPLYPWLSKIVTMLHDPSV